LRREIENSDGIPNSVDHPSNLTENQFQGIIPGDESWFADLIEFDAMFVFSPAEVTATVRPSISCRKVMIAHFFRANGRLILDALPKGSKYNQDDFIDNLLRFEASHGRKCSPQRSADLKGAYGQFNMS
jgi:hypothetical protein